jgi:hypothetical protein
MGKRVREFCRQHPDSSPGYVATAARLEELLTREDQLVQQQMDGVSEVHAATARKRELKELLMKAHLDHLISVAQIAAVEEPEVAQKFVFPAGATTYLAFQAAANGIAAEAEGRKELLVKHGMSEEVLSSLKVTLQQFETAVEQGAAGRLSHVGATAELVTLAEEIVQVVKVMNGLVRLRFANQGELLAAWESASSVVADPKPDKPVSDGSTPPTGTIPIGGTSPSGEIKPAA